MCLKAPLLHLLEEWGFLRTYPDLQSLQGERTAKAIPANRGKTLLKSLIFTVKPIGLPRTGGTVLTALAPAAAGPSPHVERALRSGFVPFRFDLSGFAQKVYFA